MHSGDSESGVSGGLRLASSAASEVRVKLTQSQIKMWLGQKLNPYSPMYNMALAFHLAENTDYDLFAKTWQQLIEETPILTSCVQDGLEYPFLCYRQNQELTLEYVDLSANSDQGIHDYLQARAARRFDIHKYMVDSALLVTKSGPIWYLNQHHLITDIWSCTLLYQRAAEIYNSLVTRERLKSRPLADFRQYVLWEEKVRKSSEYQSAIAYWQSRPNDEAVMTTIASEDSSTTASERVSVHLGEARSTLLSEKAMTPGVRTFSLQLSELNLFLTALFTYLYRVLGKNNPVVGLIFHSRDTSEMKRTVGPLIETCLVGVDMQPGETFDSLHRRLSAETLAALRNLKPGISAYTINRSYDVVLNFITAEFADFCGRPAQAEWIHSGHVDANHQLRLQVHKLNKGDSFNLSFDLKECGYAQANGKRIVDHFLHITDRMLDDFTGSIDSFDLLSNVERRRQVVSFNQTSTATLAGKTVVELFAMQVERTPHAQAVRCGNRVLTYRQFDDGVNRLAHRLIQRGVAIEDLIGVEAGRSIETLTAIMAVLKAGAAYVPFDSTLPSGRQQQYLEGMQTYRGNRKALVLTHTNSARTAFSRLGAEVVDAASVTMAGSDSKAELSPRAGTGNLAYVLFTSGSTGQPKGVMVEHGNLVNYLVWARREYAIGEQLAFPLFTSLSFDLTATSLFVPLISGHCVVVYPDRGERSDLALFDVLAEDAVDVIKLTPSHLKLMVAGPYRPVRLKKMIIGGEDLKSSLAQQAFSLMRERVSIYNEYGPTETTVGCMIHRFSKEEDLDESVPIGRPIANSQIYILDAFCNPVPTGVIGEICVGGAGVARGYLNAPELSAERFIQHPFLDTARMYRTGDLAKWDGSGRIVLIGRADRQIKVRGFRIELGEIESVIESHPEVQQCVIENMLPSPTTGSNQAISHCIKCGLPSNYPNAALDSDGICKVCRVFEQKESMVKKYFDTSGGLKKLAKRIIADRSGDYDCIVLFSGGKDSTYMLCKLVELGLRPLAFTLDNGFISQGAKANIARVVEHLHVDHTYGQTAHMNQIFTDSLERHSNVCNGCFKTIYTLSTQLARRKGIKYIITGLSKGQLFETRLVDMFEDDIFSAEQIDNYIDAARKAYHRMDDAVSHCLDVEIFKTDDVFRELEFIDFFRYCDSTLADIYDYLANRVPWIRPADTGRSTNCLINDVGIYVHRKERGYHNYALPYSWDVRLGHKDRSAALEELDDEIDTERVESILNTLGYRTKDPGQPASKLVAFCAAQLKDCSILDAHVQQRLPSYMQPDQYVMLECLPLTPHGKVDSQRLRAQVVTDKDGKPRGTEPKTPVEARLCDIWRELLSVEAVGTTDSFFELGGDSLLIVRAVAQIEREFDVRIELTKFFEAPTVQMLGAMIDGILLNEVMDLGINPTLRT